MFFWSRTLAKEIAGLTAVAFGGTTYYIGLVLLSVAAIMLSIHAYRVWQEIHEEEEPDSPADLLESFEQAHAEGELDEQELERVRRLLQDEE
jgi:uncharacterized membrane protein